MKRKRPKLPKRVRICHLDFKIRYAHKHHADLPEQYGWFDPQGQRIFLVPGMTLQREREVLMHEIGHGINDIMNLDNETDEAITTRGSAAWQAIRLSNPEVIEFLFDCKVNKSTKKGKRK